MQGNFPLDEPQQSVTVDASQRSSVILEAVSVADKVHLDVIPVISCLFGVFFCFTSTSCIGTLLRCISFFLPARYADLKLLPRHQSPHD